VLPGDVLFFGLPGNPISSAVGMRFFVEAALRRMLAMPPEQPWRLPLAQALTKKPGFHLYQKAELQLDAHGALRVGLLKGQESFKNRPLLRARVWAGLPAAEETLAAGALVDVQPLCHFDESLFART
jgi:molybdopterin molybdotransferase